MVRYHDGPGVAAAEPRRSDRYHLYAATAKGAGRAAAGQAQAQLQDRQLRLANAGSIAEAALSLNGVFDAAQAAADQYLQAVRTSAAETQAQKEQILANAERQAKEIVDTAERQAAEHWKRFQLQAGQLIQAHAELQEMFKGMANR